jgi:hypothetical protein
MFPSIIDRFNKTYCRTVYVKALKKGRAISGPALDLSDEQISYVLFLLVMRHGYICSSDFTVP